MTPEKALSGLKVLEYGDFVSVPFCGKLLADLGAEVIKVEKPAVGDYSRQFGPFLNNEVNPEKSALFLNLNTNKDGITLNLAVEQGRGILQKLLKKVDIFLEDIKPAQLEEWKLTHDELKIENPQLIQVSITPYGLTSPYRNYKAYHINVAAFGGASTSGYPDREPLQPVIHQCYYQAGGAGATGTLLAVLARKRIGHGQLVDISSVDVQAMLSGGRAGRINTALEHGWKRLRTGFRNPGPYPWGILNCKDGYISVIAIQGYQWSRTLRLIGKGEFPEWYRDDPRFEDRLKIGREYAEEVDALWEPWRMQYTKEELFKMFQDEGIPYTPVYNTNEIVNHPHLRERCFFQEIERDDLGKVKLLGAPYRLSETPWRLDKAAPQLGEHNLKVYGRYLGYSEKEINRLSQLGVI